MLRFLSQALVRWLLVGFVGWILPHCAWAQSSIQGEPKPCVGPTYSYTVQADCLDAQSFYWNISGGQITGGGGQHDSFVDVIWTVAGAGRLSVSISTVFRTCNGCRPVDPGSNNCSMAIKTVAIQSSVPQPGQAYGSRSVPQGVNSGTIQLVDYTGAITDWEYLSAGTSMWQSLGTATEEITYENLSSTTQYRAVFNSCAGILYSGICTIQMAGEALNWTENRSYNEQGVLTGGTRTYVDRAGKAVQSQTKNLTQNNVLAQQPLFGQYDQAVGATLPVPINTTSFAYQPRLVTRSNDPQQAYNYQNFDTDVTQGSPEAVGNTTQGTIGWYYSTNNTQEPYTPATAYPYSRSLTASDGSTNVVRSTLPGEVFRAGAGRETVSGQFGLAKELDQYLTLRNKYFITNNNSVTAQNSSAADLGMGAASLQGAGLQQVIVTANGEKVISLQDKGGHTLASMRPATATDAWLTTQNNINVGFQYYLEFNVNGQPTVISNITFNSINDAIIYDVNRNIIFNGDPINFTPPTSNSYFKVTANKPFQASYAAWVNIGNGAYVWIDAKASKEESTQEFYNFYTLAQGAIDITPVAVNGYSDYKLLNTAADPAQADVTAAFKANPGQLPAGFYRLIVNRGQVTLAYTNRYKDISFSFYNQLGQVVGSLAPNGVKSVLDDLAAGGTAYASASALPFFTANEYDQQGRLTASTETDAGRTEYVYRTDGKIRFSQNAKQQPNGYFSYTNYDAAGRVIEVGEGRPASTAYFASIRTDATVLDYVPAYGSFAGGFNTQQVGRVDVVQTTYDVPATSFSIPSSYTQTFTNGRVSATAKYSSLGSGTTTDVAHTLYSYDEQGRLTWLVKQIGQQPARTVAYAYDLAGKVLTVCYQQNTPTERLTHYYAYDADGRLIKVETNKEQPTTTAARTEHARYEYYLHGPLKRIVYGHNANGHDLQGVDYTYTAQGWLKGINNEVLANDPGGDGLTQPTTPDLFGMSLHYYSDPTEYTSRAVAGKTTYVSTSIGNDNSRYDGTLSGTGWQTPWLRSNVNTYSYRYDYKSQLAKADYGRLVDLGSAQSFVSSGGQYQEAGITYDSNGNIRHLQRTDGAAWSMLDGIYNYGVNTNKLEAIKNTNNQDIVNYSYDALGQMIAQQEPVDPAKNKYLEYDVTGKVTAVYRDQSHTQLLAQYTYDEFGQRLIQQVYEGASANTYTTTYFVRDVAGNELATYVYSSKVGALTLYEQPIYGAARLGVYRQPRDQEPAQQLYELNDQLGNTRVVFREPTTQNFTLTMDGSPQNIRDEQANFPDPNPSTYNDVLNTNYAHTGSNSIGLIKQPGLETSPSKTLLMQRGDKLELSVFAGYPDGHGILTRTAPRVIVGIGAIGRQAAPANPNAEAKQPMPGWQQALSKLSLGLAFPIGRQATRQTAAKGGVPQAWLRYTITRADNGNFVRDDFAFIDAQAEGHWEPLQLSLEITEDYPVNVEVSMNNNDWSTMVYFDDLLVKLTTGLVVQENHFYPYGQRNEGISWTRQYLRNYGRGYQGQNTRFDEETGYTAFELRMYDARFGRWLSTDPARQYASPYVGMGNSPVNNTDPTGGEANNFYRNKESGLVQWFDGNAEKEGWENLGLNLNLKFISYIDGQLFEGPSFLGGTKLTSSLSLHANTDKKGHLLSINAYAETIPGKNLGFIPASPYPGLPNDISFHMYGNGSLEYTLERHVQFNNSLEETGMNMIGFAKVDVGQKLVVTFSNGIVGIKAYTDQYPSAKLYLNNKMLMYYKQPGFPQIYGKGTLFSPVEVPPKTIQQYPK